MNATTKHTPGTMEVDQLGEGRCVVLHSPGGHQIIECGYNATAQEIARRYNTHGALLAFVERVSNTLRLDGTARNAALVTDAADLLRLARGS